MILSLSYPSDINVNQVMAILICDQQTKNAPNSRIFFCFKVEAPELLNSYYLILRKK